MLPLQGWLVDFWGGIDPECWNGCESKIFISENARIFTNEVSSCVRHQIAMELGRRKRISPIKEPMDSGILGIYWSESVCANSDLTFLGSEVRVLDTR